MFGLVEGSGALFKGWSLYEKPVYQSKMRRDLSWDKKESKQDLEVASGHVVHLLQSFSFQTHSSLRILGDAQIQPAINSTFLKGGRS